MIKNTTPQNIIVCDTITDLDSIGSIPDGVRVICEENNKAYVSINGALVDLTAGGTFSGTLDDIPTGSTNVHLTTTLKSTYDGLVTNSHAPGSDNQDLSGLEPKQAGKSLSTNDLTDTLKSDYDGAVTHAGSSHAPSNAQKNSDITKAEIEAKLTGEISSHTHAGGSQAFPVGSVFIAIVATDPATLLGYGTWVAIASGKMLIGLDSGDATMDTAEETGGAKTITLAATNIPELPVTVTDTGHQHLLQGYPTATGSSSGYTRDTSMSGTPADSTLSTKTNTTGITAKANSGVSASAHANLPPFFVVYIWKRTA